MFSSKIDQHILELNNFSSWTYFGVKQFIELNNLLSSTIYWVEQSPFKSTPLVYTSALHKCSTPNPFFTLKKSPNIFSWPTHPTDPTDGPNPPSLQTPIPPNSNSPPGHIINIFLHPPNSNANQRQSHHLLIGSEWMLLLIGSGVGCVIRSGVKLNEVGCVIDLGWGFDLRCGDKF